MSSAITPPPNPSPGRLRALIADDHPINAKVMSVLLQQMGLSCTVVANGALAVQAVASGLHDVVFMDYHMPELDGFGATQAIRALPAPLCHTPVILVTADVAMQTQDAAELIGVDAFVSKPVRVSDLKSALERAVLRQSSAQYLETDDAQGTMDAETTVWHLPPELYKTPMIDAQLFQELRDLIPADQWQIMLDSLFAPESGDVAVLSEMITRGDDRQTIGDQAHKLKGAALLMGLKSLGQSAAALEQMARLTQDPITADWAERMQSLAQASNDAARGLLAS
jgi:CheY-like chemotaxis protein/HPt (histidine-containing phosphotransfer) domain-containing protein